MESNKRCPLNKFAPCLLGECAWYYANECAVASTGWIDHTLRAANGLTEQEQPEEV